MPLKYLTSQRYFPLPSRLGLIAAVLLALLGLAGCNGNYKFNDDQYRPLGEPQVVNRGR
ncbi:hypothetical protein D3C79_1096080 [compost metagenome]